MSKVTRRGFIKQTSTGLLSVGALTVVPGAAIGPHLFKPAAIPASSAEGPLVAHVSDAKSGEIALMVGTREIVVHDPELVARLQRIAR